MEYSIHFNARKINKIGKAMKMSQESVLTFVDIDLELLKEKDSWYFIDSKVCFFKPRRDSRVAGECISKAYAEALNNETADYKVVELDGRLGLMSENFQDISNYSYYDFCQLHRLFPSFPKRYNCFTLKELLRTFDYHYDEEASTILKKQVIERYVYDWFCHQLDGNPRNTNLRQNRHTGVLELGPVYDKEQAFGINENGCFDEKKLEMWLPSIPYEDLSFRENPYQVDGLDANIFSLLIDYPEMTIEALEQIFRVDYDTILKSFTSGENPFSLPDETLVYLQGVVERKKYEKVKLLQSI